MKSRAAKRSMQRALRIVGGMAEREITPPAFDRKAFLLISISGILIGIDYLIEAIVSGNVSYWKAAVSFLMPGLLNLSLARTRRRRCKAEGRMSVRGTRDDRRPDPPG